MRLSRNPGKAPGLRRAFTLIEMLVVIAIISILMTAGSIGLSGVGGKGVSNGVATAESLFAEARATAVGRNIRSAVLVAKELDNNSEGNLKRMVVAYEEIDPTTGEPKNPDGAPNWVLSSRGAALGDSVFFSAEYSRKDHDGGTGMIEEVILGSAKPAYQGRYFVYEFNGEGIAKDKGASFVIGSGAKRGDGRPVTTASAKRDFGGFVVWRNGRTSLFRSPDQISKTLTDASSGTPF